MAPFALQVFYKRKWRRLSLEARHAPPWQMSGGKEDTASPTHRMSLRTRRCRLPLQSHLMKLPDSFDRSCVLVPRVVDTGISGGPRRVHQRCFQLVRQAGSNAEVSQSAAAMIGFMKAAAEEAAQAVSRQEDAGREVEGEGEDRDDAIDIIMRLNF